MLEHVSNTLFSSILYRPLGCCLSEEVLSLLQRAAVRQKLAVGHFVISGILILTMCCLGEQLPAPWPVRDLLLVWVVRTFETLC